MIEVVKKITGNWVTFTILPPNGINSVTLKGEWNGWKDQKMKQKKSGEYYCRKKISPGSWQFGYKLGNSSWINDETCEMTPSPFGSENSLLKIGEIL